VRGRGRLKLAVSLAGLSHEIPLTITALGVDTGVGGVATWDSVQGALGGHKASAPTAPDRIASWLKLRHRVASIPSTALPAATRVLGFPVDHPLHPGAGWVVEHVRGGALDLGMGVRGLDPHRPHRVVPLNPSIWASLGIDPQRFWRPAVMSLEASGNMAALQMRRSGNGLIEATREADPLTLLGSSRLREALAAAHGGMATVAMPSRDLGWVRLSAVDPAFVPPAAMATEDLSRGFTRPLLVTAEEVVLGAQGRWSIDAVADGRITTPDFALRA
jgi:hypothetical protein